MGTADYCGKGEPHTADGTWISMFNVYSVASQVANRDDVGAKTGYLKADVLSSKLKRPFFFEAAWRAYPPSTAQVNRPGEAFCVTKKRWATMPAECVQLKPKPPLTAADGLWVAPVFCEEFSEDDLEKNFALLFSYSLFLDIGLYRCERSSSWLTTAVDELDISPASLSLQVPPKMSKVVDGFNCQEDDFEGTVLRVDARDAPLPDGFPVDWSGLKQLYRHTTGPNRYITNTTPPAVGEQGSKPIGYILPAQVCPQSPFCGAELKLYQAGLSNNVQYLTTAKVPPPPFGLAPKGTAPGTTLGYLLRLKPQLQLSAAAHTVKPK
jgi:hypothetical protein